MERYTQFVKRNYASFLRLSVLYLYVQFFNVAGNKPLYTLISINLCFIFITTSFQDLEIHLFFVKLMVRYISVYIFDHSLFFNFVTSFFNTTSITKLLFP